MCVALVIKHVCQRKARYNAIFAICYIINQLYIILLTRQSAIASKVGLHGLLLRGTKTVLLENIVYMMKDAHS